MKIGLVLDDSLDRPDGVQQYVTTVGQWLQGRGHEVHYIVGETRRIDLDHLHSLAKNSTVSFNGNRLSIPRLVPRAEAQQLLKNLRLDVLHVQMPFSPFMAGRLIDQITTEALVGTFHILPVNPLAQLGTHALGLLQRSSLKKFTVVMATSEPAQQFAHTAYGVTSYVVPNPVDLQHFRTTRPRNNGLLHIVFLGRLVERKGCQYLLRAIKLLHDTKELDRVRVHIGGKGPLDHTLQQFARQHGLQEVVFDGFIPENQKPAYLAQADIAVFPAVGGESFGIVLTEAMAAGARVVIGGDNPGYRSVLGEQPGQLVNPKNTESFAKLLKHYLVDQNSRQKAADWQRRKVMEFDIGRIGPEILSYYEQALQVHRNM